MATIIVPVRQEIACIVQDGVRYCESQSGSASDMGLFLIFITLWTAGFLVGGIKVMEKWDFAGFGVWMILYLIATGFVIFIVG